ncbi:hypothetical protein [Leucobacter sp. USHLN153]|uniref:hypothetical protein n=1 Tax=Leucobacter sp. USHLN153 TaxID=3081268 RepID=UPI003018F18A
MTTPTGLEEKSDPGRMAVLAEPVSPEAPQTSGARVTLDDTANSVRVQEAGYQPTLKHRSDDPQPAAEVSPPSAVDQQTPTAGAYLRSAFTRSGIVTLAALLVTALVPALLGATSVLFAIASGTDALIPTFVTIACGLLFGLGAALGGGIVAHGVIQAGPFSAEGFGTLFALPLGVYALIIVAVVLVLRRRARWEPTTAPSLGAEALRALTESVIIAAVLAGLAAVAQLLTTFELGAFTVEAFEFEGTTLRTQSVVVFAAMLVVMFVTLFVARTAIGDRSTGRPTRAWLTMLTEGGRYLLVQASAFGVLAIVGLVVLALDAQNPAVLFTGLPLLGNLAIAAMSVGHLGHIDVALGSLMNGNGTVFDLPRAYGAWFLLVALLALVAASGVIGVRRPRAQVTVWRRVWQMPLLVAVVWAACTLGLAGVAATGDAEMFTADQSSARLSLSWSAPVAVGIGALLASVLAEYLPAIISRVSPRLLAVFGRRAARDWLAGKEGTRRILDSESAEPRPQTENLGAVAGAQAKEHMTADQTTAVPEAHPVAEAPQVDPATPTPAEPLAPATDHPRPPRTPRLLRARRTRMPRHRRRLVVALISLFVVIGVGGGAALIVSALNQQRDPSRLVHDYLDLIADGRAEEANRAVGLEVEDAERELLSDEVLGSAVQRIEVIDVVTAKRTSDGATVHATLSLAGQRFEQEFLVEAGPKEFLLLDTWTLTEPLLVPVTLTAEHADTVLIGDVEVDLRGDADADGADDGEKSGPIVSREFSVYPAVYEVTGEDGKYVDHTTETLRAAPSELSEGLGVTVGSTPNSRFEQEVLRQVQQRVTACAVQPTNLDKVCPFLTQDSNLSELKVVSQVAGFDELGLGYFTSRKGKLAVRSNPSALIASPRLRDTTITVSGDITFAKGKPVIENVRMSGW